WGRDGAIRKKAKENTTTTGGSTCPRNISQKKPMFAIMELIGDKTPRNFRGCFCWGGINNGSEESAYNRHYRPGWILPSGTPVRKRLRGARHYPSRFNI